MKTLEEIANEAYYNEEQSLITDEEFNLLSDTGIEISNFRNKTEHYQAMGSLKKIKTKEEFEKWVSGKYKVTPKLDGNSIELVYENGILIKAITRGNGYIGNNCTDKVVHCNIKYSPTNMELHSVKCEAIMKKEFQKLFEKNIRNVVAGTLGRKSVVKEELNKIDILVFEELDSHYFNSYEEIEKQFHYWKEKYPYEIDGIVVELETSIYKESDKLLPANIIALKFNKDGIDAVIGKVEWNLGKHGRLTPVLILEKAIDIDGTMVQRVSASNYGILKAAGLNVGAKVKVIKSGDIIPYISSVISKSKQQLMIPCCPKCGSEAEISESGIHATCPNNNCLSKKIVELQHIFKVFDLEYISDSTIENLFYNAGFISLEDFLNASEKDFENVAGFGKSKTNNIISKLKNLKLTEAQVIECAMVKGISSSQSKKLIEHFGNIENFIFNAKNTIISDIEGFGIVLEKTIHENINQFFKIYSTLKNCNVEIIKEVHNENKKMFKNIGFTGVHPTMTRKELSTYLEDKGYTIQSTINKNTDLLLTSDPNSISSKTKKAKELNVNIISYEDFFKS